MGGEGTEGCFVHFGQSSIYKKSSEQTKNDARTISRYFLTWLLWRGSINLFTATMSNENDQ